MQNIIHPLPVSDWNPKPGGEDVQALLESGQIPYFPNLKFDFLPQEKPLLSDRWSDGKSKNINLRPGESDVRGTDAAASDRQKLHGLISRFSKFSTQLVAALIPSYVPHLIPGGTSFRPVEVRGRKTSWRKDDSRLHVDAFPSNPVRGFRLLRVFTNVNPIGATRDWRVGEPFPDFAAKFLPRARKTLPFERETLHALGITKKKRSLYDHDMLQLHDSVKADLKYQKEAPQQSFGFPPGSTWLVFSDQVLHAAMGGQFMMEQTFYLPPEALAKPEQSPLGVLEKMRGKKLLD